jgi:hypothetical protein
LIAFLVMGLYGCQDHGASKTDAMAPSSSEVLCHFIRLKTDMDTVNGTFIFACGPYCKGCLDGPIRELDSIYVDSIDGKEWYFFTSHQIVMQKKTAHLRFTYDPEWERINFDFQNVMLIRLKDNQIVEQRDLSEKFIKRIMQKRKKGRNPMTDSI